VLAGSPPRPRRALWGLLYQSRESIAEDAEERRSCERARHCPRYSRFGLAGFRCFVRQSALGGA